LLNGNHTIITDYDYAGADETLGADNTFGADDTLTQLDEDMKQNLMEDF
jgi:hypothetical protein